MNILEELDADHRLVERAAGALVRFARDEASHWNPKAGETLAGFIDFFSTFMINYHTKKEENLIFEFFKKTGLPPDKGPLYYYELEHKNHGEALDALKPYAQKETLDIEEQKSLVETAEKFCGDVWEHIDKEDSVVFQEVTERIRGTLRIELEKAAEIFEKENSHLKKPSEKVKKLIDAYRPVEMLDDTFRGDGCMSCRYYGEGCSGIEHEWWSEHEWEDFFARNNRD